MSWILYLRSCPKRSQQIAAQVLQPKLGIVRAEEVVKDPGGRCVLISDDRCELDIILVRLQELGCAGSIGEKLEYYE